MKYTTTPVAVPQERPHRFRLQDNISGGGAIVALERHWFGPFWHELDARLCERYSPLSEIEKKTWRSAAELELTEEWFARELAELRR